MRPLILVALLAAGYKAEQEDECPRYSAEELKASVFDPIFKRDLTAMKQTFDLGVDGITEIMEGLGGKKSTFSLEELANIATSVKQMGYRFGLDLMGSKMTMDAIWEGFSPENENGKVPDTLEGYRTKFQDVHQQIHAIHNIADEPFGNLAVSAKSILDPMIKLMEVFLSKSEGKGNNREEILSKLKSKNKLLGNVLGKLVFSQVDGEPLPKPDYLHNTNDLWSDFTAFFYTQGLREKMEKGQFFKAALEKFWKRNPNKFCSEGQTTEECQTDTLVDMLASVMYNTESSDKSWMPTKEDFGK